MPVTGTPPLAHGCQLTACLSLQRARVERFRFANGFCALESFRLAMIGRADRREELSATLIGTRTLAPAKPVDGEVRHATSPLRGSRGRTGARLPVRLFGFGGREASPRPVGAGFACQYHAQACSLGVSDVPQASPSRHLRCVPCAKYRHGSARARDGLISLPPLHSVPLR